MNFFFKRKARKENSQPKRILFPTGILLDVPTCRFDRGMKGESIMVGGLGPLFAIMAGPNSYKSTILHHIMLTVLGRICESGNMTMVDFYDTEQTAVPDRLLALSKFQDALKDIDVIGDELIQITDAVGANGDEWFKGLRDWLTEVKLKERKATTIKLPMLGYDGKPMEMLFPTLGEIDSLSEMSTDSGEAIEDKSTISGSEGNMLFMRDGLAKQKLMMRLARLCNDTDHYMLMSAHVGEKFDMATGPMAPKPTRDVPHMKSNEKAKNVPSKFYFLPTQLYQPQLVSPFINSGTKGEEFPRFAKDEFSTNVDLNKVRLKCIRSKTGQSGWVVDIIVSQSEGVLPSLTELNYLRDNNNFGIIRSGQGGSIYAMEIYPEVTFTRNTFREKVAEDPKLARAINITAELHQLRTFHKDYGPFPEMNELYTKLANTYDWNELLETRGYWTINQYDHPKNYLSCLDIINMFKETYVPFWFKAGKTESKKALDLRKDKVAA